MRQNAALHGNGLICYYCIILFCYVIETDYPPKANAGSDIVIHLPVNYVTLYGNSSTDDKKIVSYEWTKSSGDELTANMQVNYLNQLAFSQTTLDCVLFATLNSEFCKWHNF